MRRTRVDADVALFAVGFASCVLLLLLTSSGRASAGLPVHARRAAKSADCSGIFGSLLQTVRKLPGGVLCFNIASDGGTMVGQAETPLACAPTQTQSECLRNIRKDLAYYAAAFRSYLDPPLRSRQEEEALLNPTLEMIQSLKKSYCLMPNEEKDSLEKVAAPKWENDSFSKRQKMCKMMRGFHVRTITINRAMGYISSGDHRK
ncbi:Interleukin-12 subunit alpha [Liparis tanakae]|uniref:Interleukin-12 subunit alpha n=1 Tax=Liparis tanakae TaxID=230148 RepID=A0A4Z2IR86_9TELE|nr:Interleukin-12 subunit alpha [Liparis tanakae]